jgi:hypothetical protein
MHQYESICAQSLCGGTGFVWKLGGGAQTMYVHVSKCNNDKIKGEKKLSIWQ